MSRPVAIPPIPPPNGEVADLHVLLRSVEDVVPSGSTVVLPSWRRQVRLHDEPPLGDVRMLPPLVPVGAADGIQRTRVVTVRSGRPIWLAAVAAGVATYGGPVSAEDIGLYLAGSHLDEAWMRQRPGGVPTVALDAVDPGTLVGDFEQVLRAHRWELEARAVRRAAEHGTVVVDGTIDRYTAEHGDRAVGVVKSLDTPYLTDEREIRDLDAGGCSRVFTLPAQRRPQLDRHSCYLRLHDAGHNAGLFGVVRLEAVDPKQLAPLAAWAYSQRQGPGSGDTRWPVHLASVAWAEHVLRTRFNRFWL